jgi:hypothetical protein
VSDGGEHRGHPRNEAGARGKGAASRTTKQLRQPVYSGSSYAPQAFPPPLELTTLFERISRQGTRYFAGRLGRARISLLQGEPSPDGTPTWRLLLQQAPETSSSIAAAPPWKPPSRPRSHRRNGAAPHKSDAGPALPNDDVSDLWPER